MKYNLPQRRRGAEILKFYFGRNSFFKFHCCKILPTAYCLLLTAYCLLIISCQKKQEWNWSEVKQLSQYEISDLKRVDDSTIIGVGGERYSHGEFYSSIDNGKTWNEKEILDKQLYGISFRNKDTLIASGYDGKILQSTNGGIDWNITQNFLWRLMRNVLWLNDSVIVSCGGSGFTGGIIARSTDKGLNWKNDTLNSEMRGLCSTDNQTIFCCGYGKIIKSTDAGATWIQQEATGDFFVSISFSSPEHGIAIGLAGTIMITEDAGANWKKIRNGNSLTNQSWIFRKTIFRDFNNGYIVGDNGLLLSTTDGGNHWIKIKNAPDANFTSIVLTDNGGLVGSEEGKLFQFLEE